MHSSPGQSRRRIKSSASIPSFFLAIALAAISGPAVAQPIGSSALWLRADAITGVADGGAVSAWNDSSGNGRNYQQATTNSQPVLFTTGANTINGKPVLRFDGSDDFLQGNAASLTVLNAAPGATAFSVRQLASTGTIQYVFGSAIGGSLMFGIAQGADANSYTTGGRPVPNVSFLGTPVSNPKTDLNAAVQTGVARFTGTQFTLTAFANGPEAATASTSSSASGFPNEDLTETMVGNNTSASGRYFQGTIAEILLYPRALDSAERSVVENYLGAKYALNLSGNATADGNYNAVNASFRTDVIGIGQASDNSLATASGLGGLSLSGTLSTADTWLYAGNDGAANALVTSGTLPAGSAGYWDRLWNVAEIGSVAGTDNLSLTFDWAAADLTSEFDSLADKTTAGFALWSGTGTAVSGFESLMAQATAVNTGDRTVTFTLTAADLPSGDNLTLVVVPEPQTLVFTGAGLAAAAWAARRRASR